MSDSRTLPAAGLADPGLAEWRTLVDKTLKGQPFEGLTTITVEGVSIAPLYGDSPPAQFAPRPFDAERPWDIRALISRPDPAEANADLLGDLGGGAASALLRIDPTGRSGVAIGSAEGMARALDGVVLEFAPIALSAGFLGPQAAEWLAAAAKASPAAKLAFHLDPLSALAQAGSSPGSVDAHIALAAATAARLAAIHPAASLFLACGRVVHEAGGGEAAELAFAAHSAVTYAKALVAAGLPMARAWEGVTLGLSADADYFLTLAKMRAARVIWAKLTAACGVAVPARIEATTSHRMLTAQDAWTNMLRLTAACAGAALGGADAVISGAFTDALGAPTAFARRQSRNAQLVLMEEAHLGRVTDPAAGSGYIEALTHDLARAAWAKFQKLQSGGDLTTDIAAAMAARDPAPKIVGVTAFPPAKAEPIEVAHPAPKSITSPPTRLPGIDTTCVPMTPIRLSQAFEVTA